MSTKTHKTTAAALISKAISYFDIVSNSKVDFTVTGGKTAYVDPLGSSVQPLPTELGNNRYDIHAKDKGFRQEIYFQNGSPANGINGISNEALVSVVLHRLNCQNESFPSPYNVLAINLLQGVLSALHSRVKDRQHFGIYDTQTVEPEAADDATIAKALAVVNSLGILGDIIIKFDMAYALATPGRVVEFVETLAKRTGEDAAEMNITTAFSLSSAAVMGSGIFRGFAKVGSEMIKLIEQGNDKDHPTNNTP